MTARLTSLTVEDFRSIRGRVHVSLDAPVVLIHGPNGTGKTSLLSAIELGLTREIASFSRVDPDYLEHLPHKEAKPLRGLVDLTLRGLASAKDAALSVNGTDIAGQAALTSADAKFFVERCYLAQSTLSRLLEIYQHQDARRSDTPLTRFVKELLGLERFDALIDGLNSSGNVTRLRGPVPIYWSAREEIPKLEANAKQSAAALEQARADLQVQLKDLGDLSIVAPTSALEAEADPLAFDPSGVGQQLVQGGEGDESRLQLWARRRRDLVAAIEQVRMSNAAGADDDRQSAEETLSADRAALDAWREGDGAALSSVIEELQRDYTDVPPIEPDAAGAHLAATKLVTAEYTRIAQILAQDTTEGVTLGEARATLRAGEARVTDIDAELAQAAGADESLAQSLSALAPHIHDEMCPVCERDFKEVSPGQPLASKVSDRIAKLVSAVGRLESLIKDKATTATTVSAAQRSIADLESRQLTAERRDHLKTQSARLSELQQRLATLAEPAAQGARLQAAVAIGAQRLAAFGSRDASIQGLQGLATELTSEFGVEGAATGEAPADVLGRLQTHVTEQEAVIIARQSARMRATAILAEIARLQELLRTGQTEDAALRLQLSALTTAKAEADRRIDLGKELVRKARDIRTAMVRKVFNDDLNALWSDLFIRLAPDEAFVPAFRLPDSSTGPVEAVLETLYRTGGKGGNPRAMLSAGNLNTAALTLFLALHLSVRPQLPWLIIDDPVQSMDEVHIAQFAALLRSLKQTHRQVIIAVHEKSLFEYLTLELSPTFIDDRLITIELGRGPDGKTVAPWNLRTFRPDRAVAA